MFIGLAARARVAQQGHAKMKMISRLAAVKLDRFTQQVDRCVIFLTFVTRPALIEIMLGQLRRVPARTLWVSASPRRRRGQWAARRLRAMCAGRLRRRRGMERIAL